MQSVIKIHCAFSIYGSKVGAHYRSTLFTDLNLEITYIRFFANKYKFFIVNFFFRNYENGVDTRVCTIVEYMLRKFGKLSMKIDRVILRFFFYKSCFLLTTHFLRR